MKMSVLSAVVAVVTATNRSSFPACDYDACASRCGGHFSGYPATCYCAKACATMDCSHGYSISDKQHYCGYEPKDRYNQCQSECQDAAAGHDDWLSYCHWGCDYWNAPCEANQVHGVWEARETIVGVETHEWDHGTSFTHSESKSKEWSESMTASVSRGFMFGKVKVSATVGHDTVQANSDEWTTWDVDKFSFTLPAEDIGKTLWQFVLNAEDSCNHKEKTMTKQYAVTAGQFEPPCCVPGWASDAPHYQKCVSSPDICKQSTIV